MGGGGGNRFERTPAEAILYDRWAEELRKGTTARSNLTTSAPRKEMSPSNASIVRVRDMVCIDASVGDPKIQPRHCHGGVGYVVEVEGVGSETVVAVKHEKLSSGVGTEYGIPLTSMRISSTTRLVCFHSMLGLLVRNALLQPRRSK